MLKLILYINDHGELSQKAMKNIIVLLDKEFKDKYSLKILDLADNPESAMENEIIATPTVIKFDPKPEKRAIGSLSDSEKIKEELGLKKGNKT